MKLRNKKTGEIAEASILNFELVVRYGDGRVEKYPLLFDYSNFEYYKEPKKYWFIDRCYEAHATNSTLRNIVADKEIGNYFETKEEAEKAVEKLKAWKRLKDKGFRFFNNKVIGEYGNVSYRLNYPATAVEEKDLDLLFGGEE